MTLRKLTNFQFQLKQPLGNWTTRQQTQLNTYYSPSTEYVYERKEQKYQVYKYENGSYNRSYKQMRFKKKYLPKDALPARTVTEGDSKRICNNQPLCLTK